VLRSRRLHAAALAALLGSILLLLSPTTGGADSAGLRQNVQALRQQNASLAAQSHSAVVSLFALDSRLSAARTRVDGLRSQLSAVERERVSVRHRLAIVRKVLTISQRNLSRRLVTIYEEGEPDALAIMLGAESLDDALTNLDHLHAIAGQDRNLLEQARSARVSLSTLTRSLEQREARLQSLEQQANAAADNLASARAERIDYLAQLSSQRRLNDRQIGSLESRAHAAEARSQEIAAQQAIAPTAAASTPVTPSTPAPVTGARSMTVVATAYALPGSTATGLPVGPGIVAVDPTVIPFGTHMTIPGYGEGVAADTGSAIKGARIDVWVPTEAQAEQWGVQTITIYLHG
jgi:3D (Asp-Asp-Asp) domain-containing protein/septal ring factor EnvC (AmiA/AmiB activator)